MKYLFNLMLQLSLAVWSFFKDNTVAKKAVYDIALSYVKMTKTPIDDIVLKTFAEKVGVITGDLDEKVKQKIQTQVNNMKIGVIKDLSISLDKGVGISSKYGTVSYKDNKFSYSYSKGLK